MSERDRHTCACGEDRGGHIYRASCPQCRARMLADAPDTPHTRAILMLLDGVVMRQVEDERAYQRERNGELPL
jgi:hypothetical protein